MRSRLLAVLAVAALAGCGGGDNNVPAGGATSPVPDAAFPVTVAADNGTVTVPQRPERIISLSAAATEILFAIGAGAQVVAVDEQSNHPPEAPRTELSGFTPNVEAIATYQPDLVVIVFDPVGLVEGLGRLGVPTLLQDAPADLDGAYAQIEALGVATGQVEGAAALIDAMRSRIDGLATALPERPLALTYYYELDDTYYTVTSRTFVGQLFALAGLENIADAVDDGTNYPQLSAEYIVLSDPDFIFLADVICCGQSAETVAARPGWTNLSAVRHGRVVELNDDIASRWGPRVVDLFETIAGAVMEEAEPQPVGG